MFERMQMARARSWAWFSARAHGKHAAWWLSFLSFTESICSVVAPDILLIAILLAGSSRWLYYAFLTTVTSVLGGIAGYFIGAFFFDTVGVQVIQFYHLTGAFEEAGKLFDRNTFWVIFTAAFTPIPYKVFVLAGGFFQVDLFQFILGSITGRALRFYLLSYLVHRFGERTLPLFFKYFNVLAVGVFLIGVVYLLNHFHVVALW